MGCYQDDKALRLLTGFYQNLRSTNSPQTCLDICTKGGFPYAGVQYGYGILFNLIKIEYTIFFFYIITNKFKDRVVSPDYFVI